MTVLKFLATLLGMHFIGSAALFGIIIGPSAILGGPFLSIFGWYFLPFEAIWLASIWTIYKPNPQQGLSRTIRIGFIVCMLGAIITAPAIPKEQNNESIYWIAGLIAGLSAALCSFLCVHVIKLNIINKIKSGITKGST